MEMDRASMVPTVIDDYNKVRATTTTIYFTDLP